MPMRAHLNTLAIAGIALWIAAAMGCDPDGPPRVIKISGIVDNTGSAPEPARGKALDLGIRHVNVGLARAGYKNLQLEVSIDDYAGDHATAQAHALQRVTEGAKLIVVD